MVFVILLGWLAIGCFVMAIAWGRVLWDFEHDTPSARLWSKAWLVSLGLTMHAAIMGVSCVYRLFDILTHGDYGEFAGHAPWVLAVVLAGLFISKAIFVWAGAIDEERQRVRWPWWAFLVALALWLVAVVR